MAKKLKAPELESSLIKKVTSWLTLPITGRFFIGVCLIILFTTVLLWTLLTANLHLSNADQIIDTYLFEDIRTFNGAVFPGTHSFMLKWPLFALMAIFGAGTSVFTAATLLMVLATVGGLVYIIYRIERRPYIFGIYCLALASILLLIPAQPYAGALLPVNMAMSTTRNLEYLVFLLILSLLTGLPRLKSWATIGAGLLLTVLIASDKLFAVLAVGGCAFAAAWYLLMRRRGDAVRALRGLMVTVAAFGTATMLLLGLGASSVTGIGAGDSASPFGLADSVKQVATGLVFAAGALLTNFGANPVHDITVLRDIPSAFVAALRHLSIVPYLVNAGLLVAGLYAVLRLLSGKYRPDTSVPLNNIQISRPLRLVVLLVGASLAAAAVYVLTDHYYPVDARYLTISLFAIVVAAAAYWRFRQIPMRIAGGLILLLAVAIPLAAGQAVHEYTASAAAMAPRSLVTARVSKQLEKRQVERLIGNYWDITPVKAAMRTEAANRLTIAPVDNCEVPRPVLNSREWFNKPPHIATAFLAVRDGSPEVGPDAGPRGQINPATYGGCSLQKIIGTYGVPSERLRIDDSVNTNGLPDVLVLLYPDGTKTADEAEAERQVADAPPAPVRKNLTALPDMADCNAGVSMQVVAHQDDDLLFMNPDILMSIRSGRCLRTVYVTAGNAGEGVNYWSGRERGAKAAYAQMFGATNKWRDERQYIGNRPVTVSYLQGMPRVSLLFMRLPDGNLRGEGFSGNDYASLHNLMDNNLSSLTAVDKSATYTLQDISDTMLAIMKTDQPDEIRTQGSDDITDGDHADHHDVGILTTKAAAGYDVAHTIVRYMGYTVRPLPANLPDDALKIKQAIFMAYADHDGAVCQTIAECQQTATYGSYLMRQYRPDQDAPVSSAP